MKTEYGKRIELVCMDCQNVMGYIHTPATLSYRWLLCKNCSQERDRLLKIKRD